jgi:ribosomal protein S18 acetylase RimI-like enzyme
MRAISFSLGELVNQLVQVADPLHERIGHVLHTHAADDPGDERCLRVRPRRLRARRCRRALDALHSRVMLASEPLSIRRYDTGDDAFIAALAREAFDEFTPHAVTQVLSMVRRCTTLVALQEVARRGAAVGSELGAPARVARAVRVGFAAIADEGSGTVVLNAIAVVRGERGRGIGQRLMLAFEQVARARGARRLELCTADCNLAALDLFYRRGFRLLRRRERFYERGQAACVLVKDLK